MADFAPTVIKDRRATGNGRMDVKEVGYPNGRFRFALLALVAVLAMPTVRAAPSKIAFNIPAGEFSQAIIEFSKQSQVEILYASMGSLGDLKTHAVMGELGVPEALTRMLEGTGFTFEFDSARSVLLKRKGGSAEIRAQQQVVPATPAEQLAMRAPALEVQDMDEVVVTGSYLHGVRDIVSPLVILGKKEQKQAAYSTVQDVLRTLSFNYGGAPSEEFSVNQNFNRGSGVNLHGLGSGATLVLVDGYRQPISGVDGDFVDVSTIPLSAVERIEVLPDGASALYGSDAIAGVVNVIMRKDLSGGETTARAGGALGGGSEEKVSQLLGNHWDGGKWLFSYEYSHRTALAGAERDYAASADKRPFGGTDLRTTSSSPGNILDPGTLQPLFAIPAGQDGTGLRPNQLLPGVVNLENQIQWHDLLPDRKTHSAYFSASQKLGDRFELFAEGRFNQRTIAATELPYDQLLLVPANNPFFVDPFGGSPFVIVAYNFSREFGAIQDSGVTETYTGALGVKANIGNLWHATLSKFHGTESMHWEGHNLVDFVALDQRLNSSDRTTAFNPFGDGTGNTAATLAAIRRVQYERAVSNVDAVNLVIDGPLPDLFSVTPRLALGVDSRYESLNHDMTHSPYDRRIAAAFSELSLPVSRRLDFSVAARYEKYSDFGSTYNPKLGLHWAPSNSLRLRGSWGTSFKAPSLVDLYDRSQDVAFITPIADPHSSTGYSTVLVQTGSNPGLHEERASTWTAGIDFAPTALPGFTWSSTYYVIDYKDQIWHQRSTVTPESLLADDQWKSLVTRDPSRSQLDAICSSAVFMGSPGDCLANPPGVILDVRARNLSITKVNGIDFEIQQALQTGRGKFNFGLNGSYLFGFEQSVTSTAPVVQLADTQGNPPELRFRGFTDWYKHGQGQPGVGGSFSIDYLAGSRDYGNPSITRIPTWVTFNAQLSYRTASADHWLGDLEMTLNAVNVFNSDPPFVNRLEGYDPVNANPVGRVVSFEIQKSW